MMAATLVVANFNLCFMRIDSFGIRAITENSFAIAEHIAYYRSALVCINHLDRASATETMHFAAISIRPRF